MDEESRILYSSVLEKAKKELQKSKENIAENHDRFSSFSFLPVLTSLREICVNPSSFFENIKGMSTKFSYVTEYAEKSISNGHKLLIFSSFTKVLDNLRDLLKEDGIASYYIYVHNKVKKKEINFFISYLLQSLHVLLATSFTILFNFSFNFLTLLSVQ